MEKRDPSYTVGGNANWYSHCGEQCGDSLKKLGIELSYDPAIPLLDIHPEETRNERDMCTQVSLQHYLQQLGHGSKLDVYWQVNGFGSCATHIQRNINQL